MSDERLLLIGQFHPSPSPYAPALRCQGRGCGRQIEPGELVRLVARDDARRADEQAALCPACFARVEARCRPCAPSPQPPPLPEGQEPQPQW